MKTKQQKTKIIEQELRLAAKRWNVAPEAILKLKDKQRKSVTIPEYCARYEVILALRDNWISNRDIANVFGYKDSSSVIQLIRRFNNKPKQYEATSN